MVQVPGAFGELQVRQAPPQALWQHTPSMQKPEAHSPAAPQVCPIGLGPQVWFTQAAPVSQSASTLHALVQAPAAQRKGWQSRTPGAPQVPSPSHVPAVLSRLPVQVGARHSTSCT